MAERTSKPARDARQITIRGAREHNLKNIDVAIPRDRLVVFTGLSGSGKSSLAFDTIYAEGQRRYVESLSAYARQFLEMMQKPDVDQIDGLSPAISIEQKTTSKNPRSTVGTVTDIATRLADSLETALKLADGLAVAEFADAPSAQPSRSSSPGRRAAAGPGEPDQGTAKPKRDGRDKPGHDEQGKKAAKIHAQL